MGYQTEQAAPALQRTEDRPVRIDYAHSDDKLLLRFTVAVDHIWLTPDGAQAMIEALQGSLGKLREHMAAGVKHAG